MIELLLETGADLNADCMKLVATDHGHSGHVTRSAWEGLDHASNVTFKEGGSSHVTTSALDHTSNVTFKEEAMSIAGKHENNYIHLLTEILAFAGSDH